MQVAAAEEFAGHRADNRPPRAVALGITLVIGAFELRVITLDDPVQRRLPRLTRAIDGRDWGRRADHGTAALRLEAQKRKCGGVQYIRTLSSIAAQSPAGGAMGAPGSNPRGHPARVLTPCSAIAASFSQSA